MVTNARNDHGDIMGRAGFILENGEFEVFLSRQVLEVRVRNLRFGTRVRDINLENYYQTNDSGSCGTRRVRPEKMERRETVKITHALLKNTFYGR